MNTSPRRDPEVFDSKEEDEIADIASAKQLGEFRSPSHDDQSVYGKTITRILFAIFFWVPGN